MPITGRVLVDKDSILDLVDQLRVAIPEEVSAAKRINAEGERIIEKAQDEATRITSRAQEQAAFLIGERGLAEAAEAEGRRIVEEAEDAAAEIRRGADGYAASILDALEQEIAKALSGIRKGIEVLDDRRADLADADQDEDRDDDDAMNGRGSGAVDEHEGSRSALLR